jgi:prolyl-tRNA synthetase
MNGKRGFIKAFWCEDEACEKAIKEETKASTRCKPLDAKEEKGKCVYCGKDAKYRWYFAQAY